jgi:hypothetical protein
MSYCYQAFGLNINSEFEIPLLTPGGDGTDLKIVLGDNTNFSEAPLFINPDYKIGRREFLFNVPGIGSFFIKGGNCIIVDLKTRDSLNKAFVYILGTAMGAVLYQRGDICLHGSVINMGDKAVLLTGDSGAGKSTISSILCSKGYPFLTDDLTLIRNVNGKVWAFPSYAQKKLWLDTIKDLDFNLEDKEHYQILDRQGKYSICYAGNFWNFPLELSYIFNISLANIDTVKLDRVTGIQKMNILTHNTYRSFLIKYFGMTAKYFELCSLITDQVLIYNIKRPHGLATQNEIAGLIIKLTGD